MEKINNEVFEKAYEWALDHYVGDPKGKEFDEYVRGVYYIMMAYNEK